MNLPIVSVIIPVYNTPIPILNRAIESVVAQDVSRLEVILVDDGSNSPTAKQCDHLASIFPMIRCIHQVNSGVSHARNTGLASCRGDWVTFLDPDDIFLPDFLSHALHLAEENDLDIVYGQIYDHWNGDESIPVIPNPTPNFTIYSSQNDLTALRSYFANRFRPPESSSNLEVRFNTHSKLYRRKVLDGVRFQESLPISEDSLFNADASSAAQKVGISNQIWHVYYHYLGSVSKSLIFDKSPQFSKLLHEAYLERGYSEATYNAALIQNVISNLRSVSRIQRIDRKQFEKVFSDPAFSNALQAFNPSDFEYPSKGSSLRFKLLKRLPKTLFWLVFVVFYGKLANYL